MDLKNSVLRKKAKKVTVFDRSLSNTVQNMLLLMREKDGVGLAAPQVGISKRIAIIEYGGTALCMINPEITKREGSVESTEGCLSIPGRTYRVPRSKSIVVRFRNSDGLYWTLGAEGMLAIIIQHEVDHLDGILISDYPQDRHTEKAGT